MAIKHATMQENVDSDCLGLYKSASQAESTEGWMQAYLSFMYTRQIGPDEPDDKLF